MPNRINPGCWILPESRGKPTAQWKTRTSFQPIRRKRILPVANRRFWRDPIQKLWHRTQRLLQLMSTEPIKVLVLCTGNSCRSIMAEALINHLGQGRYQAWSAGSHPAGYVHPDSIATLKRHGIDPGQPRSKSWNDMTTQPIRSHHHRLRSSCRRSLPHLSRPTPQTALEYSRSRQGDRHGRRDQCGL